jgi:very-short-patch-repair endonuclease
MQIDGVKFRRQEPIGSYVVDFVSYEKRLVIEIDGGQHNEKQAIEKDRQRTMWLEHERFRVIRFWNNEVLLNLDGVMMRIMELLK